MKKNLFCFFLAAVFLAPLPLHAIPIHNINLDLGISLPGEKEICTYYNIASVEESIRVYNIGVSYDLAPVEFMSIGAGLNFALRSFIMPYTVGITPYEDNVSFSAIEPFARLRGYLPIMEGLDLFVTGGVGYAVLMGSSIADGRLGATTAVNGGAPTFKFGGGAAYNQGMFTAILDIGYKIASITSSPAVLNPNWPGSAMVVNLGGFYFNVSASIGFGSHAEAKNEGEIKKQLDKDVSGLDTSSAGQVDEGENTEKSAQEPVLQQQQGAGAAAERTKEESWIDSASVESTPVPVETKAEEAVNTPEPVKTEIAEPVKTEVIEPVKTAENEKTVETEDNTDGIIIISPGESEMSQLEKYVTNKSKQFKPSEEEPEGTEESGGDLIFKYEPEDSGIIVVESETKGTVDRAGFVLVEKGGFISNNFPEDGFIYSLDEHKELLSTGDFAYIKLTAGIGAPNGKQFTVFDDSEEIFDQSTGEQLGRLIKTLGVVKVAGPIEDNIFKVQIVKCYDPIRNNCKIKARNDLKKYHKEINLKVRKKSLDVRAFIVKVKDDVMNLKSRDLVYLDAGLTQGLLPGVKMGVFRQMTDSDSGKQSEYEKLGTLIIINSMQTTSVGLIVNSTGVIKVGDVVKTLGK